MQHFWDLFKKYYTKYTKMSSIIKHKYTDV